MNLIKCSAKAMQLCPDAKICCTQRQPAEFAEGSECHKFNEEVESLFTNSDHIRSMSDEELAGELMQWRIETAFRLQGVESNYPYTQKSILEWLKQPKEKEK